MSGHTLAAFNHFLNDSYSELVRKAIAICQDSEYSNDLLNSSIERTIQRIRKSGFTDTTKFGGYVLQTVKHEYFHQRKKSAKRCYVDAVDYKFEIENKLLENEHSSQSHHSQIEKSTKYLFQYLDRYYPPKHVTLYKIYYLTENDTYRKLVQSQAGLTMSSVKKILSVMKMDVKRNLIPYVIYQESIEVWRDVNNYPLYQISNKQNLRNIFNQQILPKKNGNYLLENEKGIVKEKSIEQLLGKFQPNEIKEFKRIL